MSLLGWCSVLAVHGQATTCATQPGTTAPPASSRQPDGQAPATVPASALPPSPSPACGDIQNVRVNVHFFLTADGKGNFTENNDGYPSTPRTTTNGYNYAVDLIYSCNNNWNNNPALRIAPGNTITPIPKRVRLALNGVYFHRDNQLQRYNDGMNPSAYMIDGANTINIFMAELPPNAIDNATLVPGFPGVLNQTTLIWEKSGTTLGGVAEQITTCSNVTVPFPSQANGMNPLWTCIRGCWTNYVVSNQQAFQMASTVNHEIGHLLGLNHTFYDMPGRGYVDCADAPTHTNCWNVNEPAVPACDSIQKVSNNLMATNVSQSSLSPCQIGILQSNLNDCLKRFVASCSSCPPVGLNLSLPAATCGATTNIWLDGRGSFAVEVFDLTIEQLNSQNNVVSSYATTIWRGIGREQLDALTLFQPAARYRVTVAARAFCATSLPATRVLYLSTSECLSRPGGAAPARSGSVVQPAKTY